MKGSLTTLSAVLAISGLVLVLVGWARLTREGYKVSLRWGALLCIFPAIAAPLFARDHWDASKTPMALFYGGMLLGLAGFELLNLS